MNYSDYYLADKYHLAKAVSTYYLKVKHFLFLRYDCIIKPCRQKFLRNENQKTKLENEYTNKDQN